MRQRHPDRLTAIDWLTLLLAVVALVLYVLALPGTP